MNDTIQDVSLPNQNRLKVVQPHETADDYGGGGGGDGGNMLQRIKELESNLASIKTDLAVIKSNYATKSDVSDAKFSIIVWVVSSIFLAQLLPSIVAVIKTSL